MRSRGEIATALTVRDLIEAGLNKPAGSQALWAVRVKLVVASSSRGLPIFVS